MTTLVQDPNHTALYVTHVLDASPRWQQLRSAAMLRARGRCEYCDYAGRGLATAHLTYERLGNETLEDLIVLCGACHDMLDRGPARARMALRMVTRKWRPAPEPILIAVLNPGVLRAA
jgi:5-methylcytosine-specific restriction endonuclease McrA